MVKLPLDLVMGSRAFAENLEDNPDILILLDMIGGCDLNI
jgi:hypothetical protein